MLVLCGWQRFPLLSDPVGFDSDMPLRSHMVRIPTIRSLKRRHSNLHSREHHVLPRLVLRPHVADGAQLHGAPGRGRLPARGVHIGSVK